MQKLKQNAPASFLTIGLIFLLIGFVQQDSALSFWGEPLAASSTWLCFHALRIGCYCPQKEILSPTSSYKAFRRTTTHWRGRRIQRDNPSA